MKKVLAGIAVFVLVFSLAATPVFAAGHGRGRGDGSGTGIRATTGSCPYGEDCPYDGGCPYDCPNNSTRLQDGTGKKHSGRHHSGKSRGTGRGIRARDGSCL